MNKKINKKSNQNKIVENEYNKVINFLEKAKPEEVYDYFENKNEFYFNLNDKIIQTLLKKKNKLINLSLANFVGNIEICDYLYETSKETTIRLASLNNNKRLSPIYCHLGGTYDEVKLKNFIEKATPDELKVFFSNSNYNEFHIDKFLDKIYPYNQITKKKYKQIIEYLEINPNTKEKSMNEYPDDGWGWFTNKRVSKKFKFAKIENSFI